MVRRLRILTMAVLILGILTLTPIGVYIVNPIWVLHGAPARLMLLKPGMTEDQVWTTLGVNKGLAMVGASGGPLHGTGVGFQLGYECSVSMRTDRGLNPEEVWEVKLNGSCWGANDTPREWNSP